MKTITFTCRVLTPMFLGGADPNRVELRPPSIKAAMRFWWRAINADKVNNGDTSALKQLENALFGGVDGESGGRSAFNIRIANYDIPNKHKANRAMLPHRAAGAGFRQAIIEGFSFDVILSFFPQHLARINVTEEQLKNLFILTCILGGLGKRSRRGFGSIDVKKINEQPYTSPISKNEIVNMIQTINPNFSLGRNYAGVHYPYIKSINIATEPSDDPTFTIGQATHDVKATNPGLYSGTVGNAHPRFSSPVFISVLRDKRIIVTTLHTADAGGTVVQPLILQQELKNLIL